MCSGGGSERLPSRTLRRLDNCKENLFVVGLYKVKCTPLANAMFIDKRKIKIKNKHYHTAIFFSVCLFILIDFGTYRTDFLSRSVQSCVQHKIIKQTNENQPRWGIITGNALGLLGVDTTGVPV